MALSYTCHFNVIDIDRELPPGRAKRCLNGIIHVSILGVAFPFYLVFAAVGYLQFGESVSGDLLTEWMGDDVMTVAQAAVAGVNILKYPLVGFGLKRMIEEALGRWFARRKRRVGIDGCRSGRSGGGIADEPGWRRVDDSDDDVDGDIDDVSSEGEGDAAAAALGGEVEEAPRWAVAVALFVLHAAAAGCAVTLRSLQLALDIIGATCGVFITFILPGWLFFAAFDANSARRGAGAGGYGQEVGGGGSVGGGGGPGLAWAGRWAHDDHGRLVRRAGRVFTAVAATLIACGILTSACGVTATLMEII